MEKSWKIISKKDKNARGIGINAALYSAFFLGLAPIFGKQAINMGLSPLGVVALRTLLATILMFLVMLIFQRKFLYIYPAGLIGCLMAGWVNGLGSLFYYSALGRIDAGLGQMLYSLYPFFVVFWMYFDRHSISKMTIIRLVLAVPAVILLVRPNGDSMDTYLGVAMMLIAAALYALHIPINQRVLADIPAPTVTLYTLIAMSAIVVPTYIFSGNIREVSQISGSWWPVLGLTLVTFLSRLTLFTGVKHLGGLQTALLGLSELIITLLLSQLWLKESFAFSQWIGALLLFISMFLVAFEKDTPSRTRKGGWFSWISTPTGISPQDTWNPNE
ncbi:MAG: DMT family transporter [Chloroflexota bacterium]